MALRGATAIGVGLMKSTEFTEALGKLAIDDSCNPLASQPFLGRAGLAFVESCSALKSALNGTASEAVAKYPLPSLIQLCFTKLREYRYEIVDFQTKGMPLSSISDRAILEAKGAAAVKHGDFKGNLQIADRIAALNPQDPIAVRQAADAYLEGWQYGGAADIDSAKQGLEKYLSQLETLDPNDSHLPEMKLNYRRLTGDIEGMQSLARELNETDPELGSYYLAWASYLQGDPKTTKALLTQIVSANPNALAAATTLKLLEQSGPPRDVASATANASQIFTDRVIEYRDASQAIQNPTDN